MNTDPRRDQTQQQDRARGRFRRAAQAFLKFVGIRRKRTTTRLTKATAQTDLRLTELEMKPDVSTALTDGTGNCDTPPIVHTAESDPALTDDTTDTDTASIDRAAICDVALSEEPTNSDISLPDLTVEADTATTEGIADPDLMPRESVNYAPTPDLFEENGVSSPKQVPAFVRNMHQRLTGNGSPGEELLTAVLRVTKAYPADVVVTLLRCAPSCDRAAASMWRTIASSGMALKKVLPELLCVMEDWPLHSTSTSDGDNTPVFALAATIVVWEILQMSQCPEQLQNYSPLLLVDLLFQVFTSKEQMPEEVDTFWKGYWEQHGLPTDFKRFAVLTIKALLCHLECEDVVVSMERKRGWDTLINADSHHYAVGLLAREMRRASSPLYSWIAPCLLELLSREKPRWELPAMAFLVEVLDCLDMTEWSDSFLEILARQLRSECPEMRRLALRGLVVLSKDPVMADGVRTLTQSLMDILWDEDSELIGMALSIIINEVQNRAILISTPTALQLAEVLQPLFGYDNICVQLLSIHLFRKVMELGVDEGKQHLKTHVIQSLLPLFFCWHDENQHVAEASWKALLRAAWLLKRRDLAELLETEQPWRFSECLLEKDKSRVAEYLCQALPYLESPQEPVREAALRFIGIAGRYLRGQQAELQIIIGVIEGITHDSAAMECLADQTQKILMTVQRPQASAHSSSWKIISRVCKIGRLLCGAAVGCLRRTDPGNPA
ncbi:LOW QUALITY PROTEIN: maestro heat-like repeat-containing protein family member 6 [Myiozetetes cayanensis]|uniref:LOW QUALITY PROTEIN: maestro heat-like repeat-containing protein family member 6 n=1 Tax=Myiozetetes cayanensis TaxID=478635 RepID=UPI00215E84D0|nr:LOW QUALITY PROTEIN: maestro heat-like repeat-containing protein family member 6 [Myiozetetes cayanensis]